MGTNQEKNVIDLKEAQEARYVAAHRKNPCIFPFKYENKTYNSCTRWHGTSPGFPDEEAFWCATSVNADLNIQNWGFCNDFCPLEGTVQVF